MGFYVALIFLTRIPLPQLELDEKKISSSVAFFPLAGAVIGGILWLIHTWGQYLMPTKVLAAVLVIADIAITGGMHIDAVADTMDGLFCYGDREKKLSVMRDSRIGAYGVMGIILLILLKYVLIFSVMDYAILEALLIYPVLGRWVMTYSMGFFPYARKEGLGKAFTASKAPHQFAISTVITLAFALGLAGVEGLAVAAVSLLGGMLLIRHFMSQFGGMTGDTYGTVNMASEVFALLAFVVIAYVRRG